MRPLAIFIAACLTTIAAPAFGCSPVEGYRTPTNFELVQKADLIFVARVVSGPTDFDKSEPFKPELEIEPVTVFKGKLPPKPPALFGLIAWNGKTIPTLPSPLSSAHFSVGMGSCIRVFYPKGGLVLAMFKHTPEGLAQMWEPFARVVEDVEGPDAFWPRVVQTYLSLQATADGVKLQSAVERRRAELVADTTNLESQAMANDLDAWLRRSSRREAGHGIDRAVFWDLPQESSVLMGNAKSPQQEIMRCREGGAGVEIFAIGLKPNGSISLQIGDQVFSPTPANLELAPDVEAAAFQLPLNRDFVSALKAGSTLKAFSPTGSLHSAATYDILPKLAARCEALLRSFAMDGSR